AWRRTFALYEELKRRECQPGSDVVQPLPEPDADERALRTGQIWLEYQKNCAAVCNLITHGQITEPDLDLLGLQAGDLFATQDGSKAWLHAAERVSNALAQFRGLHRDELVIRRMQRDMKKLTERLDVLERKERNCA